jgi:oxaloacetate decarboxylase alpha subunit
MTYGHSPTESLVAILQGSDRDTGLDLLLLEEIAAYFRKVRKKYAQFEGSLRGIDSRILVAQVPGGMLTNLENQLREQDATDKLDEVLEEIPRVREELGFIPLVTPTSQIVGTQAVLNVLTGARYSNITRETQAVLKGEYGATPAPVDEALQARALDGADVVTCRPADLLEPEFETLSSELSGLAKERSLFFGKYFEDDVLTYALFPQVGLKFFENRQNPDAFEPIPVEPSDAAVIAQGSETYTVEVDGQHFVVSVSAGGDVSSIQPLAQAVPLSIPSGGQTDITAPLSGNVFKVLVGPGDAVSEGDVVIVLEAMKMETEIRATRGGQVTQVPVREGDAVKLGDALVMVGQ